MADNRTGLSAADLAAQFRDVCGDGSMEWVYTPMQTWLLLDAADMLDENTRLRSCLSDAAENARLIMGENAELREELSDVPKCESCEAMLDCDECLRADASQKERKRLDYEVAKLRELVEDMLDCIEIRAAWHRPLTEGMCEEFAKRASELGVVE